jgi:hypothetical protein
MGKPYNLVHSFILYLFSFYVCDSRKFGVYEVGVEDYICGEKIQWILVQGCVTFFFVCFALIY